MKKVLIASTALILVAGAAAAEVKVSGSARMGVVYDGSDAAFSSRVRIVFDGSGETDGGLAFGASMRADQAGGNGATNATYIDPGVDGVAGTGDDVVKSVSAGSTGTTNGDSTVFISGAFGKLTMGDTGNAVDSLLGQVSGAGYGPYDAVQEIAFVSRDVTGASYEYSAGALTFVLGLGQPTDDTLVDTNDDFYSAAVKYKAGSYSVGLGYEKNDTNSAVTLVGSATFGAATVKAKAVQQDVAADDTAYALSVDYAMGATTLTAFMANNRNFAAGSGDDTMGIGAAYDLGGGAALKGAIQDDGTNTIADLGVTFSF